MWTRVAIVLCILAVAFSSAASGNVPKQETTIYQRVQRLETRSANQAARITKLQNQLDSFEKLICNWSPAC